MTIDYPTQKHSLYTTREVAALLGVSPQTITRWIRHGIVPAVKLGPKEYRISNTVVEEILKKGLC